MVDFKEVCKALKGEYSEEKELKRCLIQENLSNIDIHLEHKKGDTTFLVTKRGIIDHDFVQMDIPERVGIKQMPVTGAIYAEGEAYTFIDKDTRIVFDKED